MNKKKYIYLTAMAGVVNFVSYFFIGDINIWAMVTCLLLTIYFIYTSYLLLFKKSYNLSRNYWRGTGTHSRKYRS